MSERESALKAAAEFIARRSCVEEFANTDLLTEELTDFIIAQREDAVTQAKPAIVREAKIEFLKKFILYARGEGYVEKIPTRYIEAEITKLEVEAKADHA